MVGFIGQLADTNFSLSHENSTLEEINEIKKLPTIMQRCPIINGGNSSMLNFSFSSFLILSLILLMFSASLSPN